MDRWITDSSCTLEMKLILHFCVDNDKVYDICLDKRDVCIMV